MTDNKLIFEQRAEANTLVAWVVDDPEAAAYEIVALRAVAHQERERAEKLQARVERLEAVRDAADLALRQFPTDRSDMILLAAASVAVDRPADDPR